MTRIDSVKTGDSSEFARDVAIATRIGAFLCAVAAFAFAIGIESVRAQNSAAPRGPDGEVIRDRPWLVPAQDGVTMMRTAVFRPPGPGPFPLAVIAHGSTQNELRRAQYRQPRFALLARWLVDRGYAVAVPQRPGHGETGGPYFEYQGRCADADFAKAGRAAADSIAAAVGFMTRQTFVRPSGAVVFGQSAGGWGALALAARNPPAVAAVVAFAPGRGGRVNDIPGRNCAPDRLVAAARTFGATARIPTLWLYAENDSFFGPDLSKRLVAAYRGAGARADFHLLPPIGDDGHQMISTRGAVPVWGPVLDKFLKGVK
ncbi:MAG: peptidase [Alphaproteobacteria bacterium]|nr:peptidase [Alphaproteobacteria bacterium]